jgi:hypothetical protein
MKQAILASALVLSLASSPLWSQVVVHIGPPPHVMIERPVPLPGPQYIWQVGYYRWGGRSYIWVPGRYVLPPRPGVVWVAPHWVARNGNWVFVEGIWR